MPLHPFASRLHLSVFRSISTLPTPALNATINDSLRRAQLQTARQLFDENPGSRDLRSWNSMIGGYVKSNQFHLAHQLFDEMPLRDIVSWNTLLSGFRQKPEEAYLIYLKLMRSGFLPSEYTISILVTSVLGGAFSVLIPQLHGQALRLALNSTVFVGSALLRGYSNLKDFRSLRGVFDDILIKDVTSWNALILGYMELGLTNDAQRVFNKMPEKNVVTWTTMVDGYLMNQQIGKARSLFDQMNERNAFTWTIMISGYIQVSNYSEAFKLFSIMMKSGTLPSEFTFSSVLDACAGCSSLLTGEQLHATIIKRGTPIDAILSSAMINMYAKCGHIEAAGYFFNSLPNKALSSWNSMIGGYSRHGLATRALDEFERMTTSSVKPDGITLVSVLSACVHGGFVEKGEMVFYRMREAYKVEPSVEHYGCMVDLYGRAGQLEKAERLIKGMACKPDVVVWGALLGACGLHSDFELGKSAAEAISSLERDHPSIYSVFSKMLGEKEMWNSVTELRNMMKEKGAKKQMAGSWISQGRRSCVL